MYRELHEDSNDRITIQQDTAPTALSKEPVPVILYGFSPSTQWAAISHYENVSGGMICEEYERHPPSEGRKYPNIFSSPGLSSRRPLTALEKKISMNYRGGQSWIKVTFDSAEAAEKAYYFSPQLIQGHSVYAEPYIDGMVPNNDLPIPDVPDDRQTGQSTFSKSLHRPTHKHPQSLGHSASRQLLAQSSTTLPRSFAPSFTMSTALHESAENESHSPSTASSATATGQDDADLRLRQTQTGRSQSPGFSQSAVKTTQLNSRNMKHFPDTPRTVLRPATEAFLPHPTWIQRNMKWAADLGLIPRDIIGHSVPRTESGQFDFANASVYWKLCWYIDFYFSTDICGLRDE